MTQPYPQQYAQPPAPQYPAQQPGFPPQYAQAPAQPQGYPMQQPGFPAPAYGQPQPQQPALATGSLDAFYSQPSVGGGAALKFNPPTPSPAPGYPDVPGTTHVGIVARPISNADIQQQTNPQNGQPATYRDGRPKFVMKVPLQMQCCDPTVHADGQGQWYVTGGARDELIRAMQESGAPEGPPEGGALIQVSCTGLRPAGQGMNPAKVYQVRYIRPNSAASTASSEHQYGQQQAAQPPAQAPAYPQQPPAPPAPQAPAQPLAGPAPQAMGQQYQQPAPPQGPPAMAQPPTPPAAPAFTPPADLPADKAALLAQLTGQAAPA